MASYKYKKVRSYNEVNQEAFNSHLEFVKKAGINIINGLYNPELNNNTHSGIYTAFLYSGKSKLKLSYKRGKTWINVQTDLTKDYDDDFKKEVSISGTEAYKYFKRFVKFEDFVPEDLAFEPCKPFSYVNDKYVGKRIDNCIGYDLNKAYLSFCKDLKGPIKFLRYNSFPKEGEVGYDINGEMHIGPSNIMCVYVFTYGLIPGMNRWVEVLSKKIDESEDPKYKKYANFAIGYLVYHHPILRHTIMLKAKFTLESLIDSNTLYSYVDSLVSMVKRPDINLSHNVGDFKVEHEGSFIMLSAGKYQWNTGLDSISAKGVSKGKLINYCKANNKSQEDYKIEDLEFDLDSAEKPWEFDVSKLLIIRRN